VSKKILGKTAQALAERLAEDRTVTGIEYSRYVAAEFVKQACGVDELSEDEFRKIANSLYPAVALACMAKLAGGTRLPTAATIANKSSGTRGIVPVNPPKRQPAANAGTPPKRQPAANAGTPPKRQPAANAGTPPKRQPRQGATPGRGPKGGNAGVDNSGTPDNSGTGFFDSAREHVTNAWEKSKDWIGEDSGRALGTGLAVAGGAYLLGKSRKRRKRDEED
jgi:hypothetical protein